MPELTYRIGGMDVDRKKLDGGSSAFFIVGTEEAAISFYAKHSGHAHTAEEFGFGTYDEAKSLFTPHEGKRVAGGGLFRMDTDSLVVYGFSGTFKSVPREVAGRFAELLKPEIEKMGFRVGSVIIDVKGELNPYWIELGFTQ